MVDDPDRITRGQWDAATDAEWPLDKLRLIVQLVQEFYELSGSFPSATELRALLRRPGV